MLPAIMVVQATVCSTAQWPPVTASIAMSRKILPARFSTPASLKLCGGRVKANAVHGYCTFNWRKPWGELVSEIKSRASIQDDSVLLVSTVCVTDSESVSQSVRFVETCAK